MPSKKTIFVTGGTGFLGSYLLRYLVTQDVQIRALKRTTSSMALVKDIVNQIEWIEGDILDVSCLMNAMKNVDQVYHCAAIVSFEQKTFDTMMQVNVEGTANIVNIALKSKIKKLVYISSIAAIGRIKNQKNINEKTQWQASKINSQYAISKYLAEQEVWRGIAEGLNAAMINPSVILGSGFWKQGTGRIFLQVWKGLRFYPIGGSGYVDVRDVAKISIQLMESDVHSERFIINGNNLSYKELFTTIAYALGKKEPTIKVAPFLQGIAWRVAWLISKLTRTNSLLTRESAALVAETFIYDNTKSIAQFNLTYTPIQNTIKETAQQFLEASKNDFHPAYLPLN